MKRRLLWLHRWLSIGLAPLLLVLIVSGGLLAVQPVVEDWVAGPDADVPVAVPETLTWLDRLDQRQRARALRFEADRVLVLTFSQRGERRVVPFDLTTGEAGVERATGESFFRTVRHLHKDLLLGLDGLVEWVTYALLIIVVTGPWLAWPRLRNTLSDWHTGLGWLTLPLIFLVTATGALLALQWGTPALPEFDRDQPQVTLPAAIARAAQQGDLVAVYEAERFAQVSVALQGADATGNRVTYVVTPGEVARVTAYPGLVQSLHQGTWAGAISGALNGIAALALGFLLLSGTWVWLRRQWQARRREGDPAADILVAYGSQTGTAARWARATAKALRDGGERVLEASLAGVRPEELPGFRQVLLIISTTGDGEVPDAARRFVDALPGSRLSGARFAVLALGDSSYRQFCAAGERLRQRLLTSGAEEVLPLVKVDGDPAGPWRGWMDRVGRAVGTDLGELEAPDGGDQPVRLTLAQRQQLNDPADPDTNEVWSLVFECAEPLDYRPGDLLLVRPAPGAPARPYSIGSTPLTDPRRLMLTVAVVTRDDGTPGEASGLLCRQLPVGTPLDMTLRRHPHFHPPESPDRPMIMVAAGCGIAPFMGFLAEQAHRPRTGPAWLLFGNRKRAGDFFYRERLQRCLEEGHLYRLDTAFSRDADDGRYVSDCIREAGAELLDWLERRDALLYACGKASTLGRGLREALTGVLVEQRGLAPPEARERLRQWEAEGRLRLDLID
ncbi:flavodoxin/nitric oxide synthase [Alkalilimnicola ehrlichii MLHE-1]|uniref:NADPH--hemoprotein reductase n=1 Tax=Alkalilimnicola ehrlichii (strain ATCC BAA-1101 / DSM 17681 / MLHE-1) TaxID=187272 RepID=Q0A7F1_ALKEH|nr:flavodoxin/nitric oxide synthase [Alkalilimnicola ehrlichii MLHE-1]